MEYVLSYTESNDRKRATSFYKYVLIHLWQIFGLLVCLKNGQSTSLFKKWAIFTLCTEKERYFKESVHTHSEHLGRLQLVFLTKFPERYE